MTTHEPEQHTTPSSSYINQLAPTRPGPYFQARRGDLVCQGQAHASQVLGSSCRTESPLCSAMSHRGVRRAAWPRMASFPRFLSTLCLGCTGPEDSFCSTAAERSKTFHCQQLLVTASATVAWAYKYLCLLLCSRRHERTSPRQRPLAGTAAL